jgi:class 3 adenylate cyclase
MRAQGIDPSNVHGSIDAVVAAVQAERPNLAAHASPEGAVTLMFSDIEGSTEMTERLGDQRWFEVLGEHNTIVREEIAAHGGVEVKTQGDSFMVAFPSPADGVRCAVAVQRRLAGRNEAAAEHEAVRIRVGLHTGEAIRDADDFFGRNVILAARVAGEARGAEILVSHRVRDLIEGFPFGSPRRVLLKGLAGEHEVVPVAWAS